MYELIKLNSIRENLALDHSLLPVLPTQEDKNVLLHFSL
jgi:hypothetical protein